MAGTPHIDAIKEAFDKLPPQLQSAARYVLDHPQDVALLSMREQARRAGVRPWTMMRLAQRLGFDGYESFRALFADTLRQGGLGFAGKAREQLARQTEVGGRALAAEMIASLSARIAVLGEAASLDALVAAAERMHGARRVYGLGLRSSYSVAVHLAYVMSFLGEKAVLLDAAAGTGADALRHATPDDVLFAVAVAPYTKMTIELARHAVAKSVPIIALTDSVVSMTRILHRQIHASLPVATGGKGVELFDAEGRPYIDASGGAAVSCLGHGHPDVLAALARAGRPLAYAHTSFFTTEAAEALADRLVSRCAGRDQPRLLRLGRLGGGRGGAEDGAAVLRRDRAAAAAAHHRPPPELPRQHARRARHRRQRMAARAVQPLLIETHHIDPCFAYRFQEDGRRTKPMPRAPGRWKTKILELGPETVMAFVAETVVGATSGAVPPVADYFRRIREICDRYGVLLILDEVMCGMGRTGTLHACEQDGVAPDLMTIAKGLGGGYQPIGAVLLSREIFDAFAGRGRACSSTATPTSAIPSPAPPRSPCRRSSGATTCWRTSGHGRASLTAAERALRQPPQCRRHSRTRPVHGRGAGCRPVHEGAVRAPAQAARRIKKASHGARSDGLSHGRHDRRDQRRPRAAGAALHRGCRRHRTVWVTPWMMPFGFDAAALARWRSSKRAACANRLATSAAASGRDIPSSPSRHTMHPPMKPAASGLRRAQ
jgi:DNA-binding MurR/RpiR family transcriptional regulator